MTIEGSTNINDSLDLGKGICHDKKPSLVGAKQPTEWIREESDLNYIDIQKQNSDIKKKYNINFYGVGYRFAEKSEVFEAIKKLEIEIFQLKASLKLSQELNASYEQSMKILHKEIKDHQDQIEFQRQLLKVKL